MFGHERPKECEDDGDSTRDKDRRNKYIVSKKRDKANISTKRIKRTLERKRGQINNTTEETKKTLRDRKGKVTRKESDEDIWRILIVINVKQSDKLRKAGK